MRTSLDGKRHNLNTEAFSYTYINELEREKLTQSTKNKRSPRQLTGKNPLLISKKEQLKSSDPNRAVPQILTESLELSLVTGYSTDYAKNLNQSSNYGIPPPCEYEFRPRNGVYHIYRSKESFCSYCGEEIAVVNCSQCDANFCEECDRVLHKAPSNRKHARSSFKMESAVFDIKSYEDFVTDYRRIETCRQDPSTNAYASLRLRLLEICFKFHEMLNSKFEKEAMRQSQVDFETIYKVDTHVHIASAPTAEHLLDYIKRKLKTNSDEVVMIQKNKEVTLKEVFEQLKIPLENLTLDSLAMKATHSYGFFDKFSLTYNPFRCSELRTIFLKKDNYLKGRYFAELCNEVFRLREKSKYTAMEFRISIYGSSRDEWNNLAKWLSVYQVGSDKNKWIIQVPRIYKDFRENNKVQNFQEMLDNIFAPIYEVTQNPSSNLKLHSILSQISGFDSVDDESYMFERPLDKSLPPPSKWNFLENPPYAYWMYYLWANITALNKFREMRGLNTFTFRPHAGATGSRGHLSAAFLVSSGISHGLNLDRSPALQYLFYLEQIPIYLSPLSEDAVYCEYGNSPFPSFFKRGLNISISTDNPLQLHSTEEPLLEEYSIAAKMWKLSVCDMSEIARNSVLQSGFEPEKKAAWLGENYYLNGSSGNELSKTNVPNIRVQFRAETLNQERSLMEQVVKYLGPDLQAQVAEKLANSLHMIEGRPLLTETPPVVIVTEKKVKVDESKPQESQPKQPKILRAPLYGGMAAVLIGLVIFAKKFGHKL